MILSLLRFVKYDYSQLCFAPRQGLHLLTTCHQVTTAHRPPSENEDHKIKCIIILYKVNILTSFSTDTFASKVSAVQDTYADASIGNVTGSNAVNVFLGIGMAWSVAAIYWHMKGKPFVVEAGSLAFSVTLFTIFAFLAISVLLYRRRAHIGGELGGPRGHRLATSAFFFGLWFLYILFSSLEAYCHIEGF